MHLTSKKDIRKLIFLFTLTYMVSYITRINYGAIILEMEKSTGFARSLLSMALTGSFITYGTGQIVSGFLGDRISPKRLVTVGISATTILNLCITLCRAPWQMIAVWCVNGFAQSLMWPPMVRMMTALLSSDDYKNATAKVSLGSMFGTVAVYLASPVIIRIASWNGVFIFSAVCGAAMCTLWNIYAPDIKTEKREAAVESKVSSKIIFCPVMIAIFVAIILQGMLRDGVTTWMPTYISEVFDLGTSVSILTAVILPVFSIMSVSVGSSLQKKIGNEVKTAAILYGVSAVSALIIIPVFSSSMIISALMMAVITGAMHGVNLMLISRLPVHFRKYGKVSTISGVLNACTYVGSAVSTYGIAVLSETMGWGTTLLLWVLIAFTGTTVCLLMVKPWNKKFQTTEH